mmetsp:Transcript_16261/g.40793  ORF Transcript_16261/g.40793 Transcript_16261/m.40793 type:complete len:92 (-) Transcript_16261:11-286(-)
MPLERTSHRSELAKQKGARAVPLEAFPAEPLYLVAPARLARALLLLPLLAAAVRLLPRVEELLAHQQPEARRVKNKNNNDSKNKGFSFGAK